MGPENREKTHIVNFQVSFQVLANGRRQLEHATAREHLLQRGVRRDVAPLVQAMLLNVDPDLGLRLFLHPFPRVSCVAHS